jgi:hypothetical protein
MNLSAMLKDLSKLRKNWYRQSENGETAGPNYVAKYVLMGVDAAIAIVNLHVFGTKSMRPTGLPYPSTSDQLRGGKS